MTSDALKRKNFQEKPEYLIHRGTDINFIFTSNLYSPEQLQAEAVKRAAALGCELYRRDSDGKIYQLILPYYIKDGKGRVVGFEPLRVVRRERKIKETGIHVEMLNLGDHIPGIQVIS